MQREHRCELQWVRPPAGNADGTPFRQPRAGGHPRRHGIGAAVVELQLALRYRFGSSH